MDEETADGTAQSASALRAVAVVAQPSGAKLGDRLVELGLLSPDQLQVALTEQKRSGRMLGEIVVALGFLTERALAEVLAEAAGRRRFDPAANRVDPAVAGLVSRDTALRHRMLPVSLSDADRVLQVAMADVNDVVAVDQLRRTAPRGYAIEPLVCAESDLYEIIDRHFGHDHSIDGILREIETGGGETAAPPAGADGYTSPTVRLVDAVIADAVDGGASDIHLEPEGAFVRLRYRIDGVLRQVRSFHKAYWPAVAVRIKVLAGMNIAEARNPQDGRFSVTFGAREIDFRVATLPTVHGENIVLRVLDKARSLVPLDRLGFGDANVALLKRLLMRPEGLVVVTGPTGSGKTTTLYSILGHLNSLEVNIMTLEDPVEYRLPLIRQAEIRDGGQLNFVDGIRSMLRQDPDILLVGEVRDAETARMALRAAITGHQVYTTLHASDALAAVPRLIDIGVPHHMLDGTMIGVVAQRLVRRLCGRCRVPRPASAEEARLLGADPTQPPVIHRPAGCAACAHAGYKGRVAVVEILRFDEALDACIARQAPRSAMRAAALAAGFVPMVDDGIAKVLAGVTSLDELIKAVDLSGRL